MTEGVVINVLWELTAAWGNSSEQRHQVNSVGILLTAHGWTPMKNTVRKSLQC